ncbi:MAG: hypothetical protein ACR2OO_15830 [Thermomicrobiales bacterium]
MGLTITVSPRASSGESSLVAWGRILDAFDACETAVWNHGLFCPPCATRLRILRRLRDIDLRRDHPEGSPANLAARAEARRLVAGLPQDHVAGMDDLARTFDRLWKLADENARAMAKHDLSRGRGDFAVWDVIEGCGLRNLPAWAELLEIRRAAAVEPCPF